MIIDIRQYKNKTTRKKKIEENSLVDIRFCFEIGKHLKEFYSSCECVKSSTEKGQKKKKSKPNEL